MYRAKAQRVLRDIEQRG